MKNWVVKTEEHGRDEHLAFFVAKMLNGFSLTITVKGISDVDAKCIVLKEISQKILLGNSQEPTHLDCELLQHRKALFDKCIDKHLQEFNDSLNLDYEAIMNGGSIEEENL